MRLTASFTLITCALLLIAMIIMRSQYTVPKLIPAAIGGTFQTLCKSDGSAWQPTTAANRPFTGYDAAVIPKASMNNKGNIILIMDARNDHDCTAH